MHLASYIDKAITKYEFWWAFNMETPLPSKYVKYVGVSSLETPQPPQSAQAGELRRGPPAAATQREV